MKQRKKAARGSEDGFIMVEAIYVVVIAIMIIFFTINIGVVYHNWIVLTAIANEAAAGVAEIYGSTSKEPFYNYTDNAFFSGKNPYRHFMFAEGELEDMAKKKAKWYASYLVYSKEFRADKNMDFSGIQVECIENTGIGMKTLAVTISREYPVFIMNPMSFWKLDPKYEVKVTGTAVCYDPIYQMNATSFKNELADRIDASSSVIKIVDNIVETVQKVKNHIRASQS